MVTTQQVVELWDQLQNVKAISRELGIGADAVRYHLRKQGITTKQPILTQQQLEGYVAQGYSFTKIGKIINRNAAFVSEVAKRYGIKSRHADKAAEIPLPEPIETVYKRYLSGDSLDKLHKEYNRPVSVIQNKLIKAYPELEFRTMDEAKRPAILNSREQLFEALNRTSCRKLARELGVQLATVTKAAKKFSLNTKQKTYEKLPLDQLRDWVNAGLFPSDIARKTGLKYGVVLRQIKAAGLPVRAPGGVSRPSRITALNDAAWLQQKYSVDELSTGEIAMLVGSSIGNVVYHLKKHGIKMRTRAEYLTNLMRHGQRRVVDGISCGSQLEERFLATLTPEVRATVKRCPVLHTDYSSCWIDFEVGQDYVEIKSRSESEHPGVNRRRLTKQWLICQHHGIDMKIWNGKYMPFTLEDSDKYYALNWKLIFKSPEECFEFLVAYGFKGIEYSYGELADGLSKVVRVPEKEKLNASYRNEDVLKLIKHFSQHYWHSTLKDHLPISRAWEHGNRSILKSALIDLWIKKREVNLYGLVKEITNGYRDFRQPSVFKPWVAHEIYKRLLPNGGVVLDPCMGWGGRLLGTVDLPIKYIGWDINKAAVDANTKLAKFAQSRLRYQPEFICGDATTLALPKTDLIFTSPPYDDSEIYAGGVASSLEHILASIFARAKCKVAVNVAGRYSGRVIDLAAKHDLRLVDTIWMTTRAIARRHTIVEPILVFE